METRFIQLNNDNFDSAIQAAAKIIIDGGLVAFPTETVYGLGANALNEQAVRSIFTAKGRPGDNPLIVHAAAMEDAFSLARDIPAYARVLAQRFWPGPLTLVLKKMETVTNAVTAGLDTVALRVPSHPVALALIKASGVPIAAPSANASGSPSPTKAEHVLQDLQGLIPMILDGGSCEVGLESTVCDCTLDRPVILRPGGITAEMIQRTVGSVSIHKAVLGQYKGKAPSPGMKHRHYAPKAKLTLVTGTGAAARICQLYDESEGAGNKTAIIGTSENESTYGNRRKILLGSRDNEQECAKHFFSALRQMDEAGVARIYAEGFSKEGMGLALMNRAIRAAEYDIIETD